MVNGNALLISFLMNNWVPLGLGLLSILPLFPPEWFGKMKHIYITEQKPPESNDPPTGEYRNAMKVSPVEALIVMVTPIYGQIVQTVFIPLQILMKYKEAIVTVIFLVVGFDIFYRKELSQESITLVSIGILALYLDQLIDKGKKLSGLFGLFHWEGKDTLPFIPSPPITSGTQLKKNKET